MHVVHKVAELREALRPWRESGEDVALVPTMGNLHEGHRGLVREARDLSECVVASVFVNPLQFGPNEDYDKYPRTLDDDCKALEAEGVQVVFAPDTTEMYPGGYPPATTVTVGGALGEILCAPFRPGHFSGMATVVNILFNLVSPQIAVFGEKDYQQLAVIRRMVADLGLPIRIVGVPTYREADGLALSSRNRYLSADERKRSAALQETLQWVGAGLRAGRRDFDELSDAGQERLAKAGFNPQYVEVRATDLSAPTAETRLFVVLAAAYLGGTRLIDNVTVATEVATVSPAK